MIHLPPLLAASAVFYGARWVLRGRVGSEEIARRLWAEHFPGDTVARCAVSLGGRVALVQSDWGIGLIARNGRAVQRLGTVPVDRHDDGLTLHLPGDVVRLRLSRSETADWHERIATAPISIEAG